MDRIITSTALGLFIIALLVGFFVGLIKAPAGVLDWIIIGISVVVAVVLVLTAAYLIGEGLRGMR